MPAIRCEAAPRLPEPMHPSAPPPSASRRAMIALVQRVAQARVEIAGTCVGAIGVGALVFVCAEPLDTPAHAARLVGKLLALRIFSDQAGKMNRNIGDVGGGLLFVPQFTLAADTTRGNRPGFSAAAPPELGLQLFDAVLALARQRHAPVAAGVFGADMQVHLVNDGPVTIPITIR
jgi:D-aminoacyl-tRNA deacylase